VLNRRAASPAASAAAARGLTRHGVCAALSRRSRAAAPGSPDLRARAQTTPLVMGLSVAAAALSARSALQYYQVWKLTPRLRKFYEGGFEEKMDRREAALILGLRCVQRATQRPKPCVAPACPCALKPPPPGAASRRRAARRR
jgi:DnaJ family protein C protein 19